MNDKKTLRDEFAMAALQGMIARNPHGAEVAARTAYEYADAMMAERAKRLNEEASDNDVD